MEVELPSISNEEENAFRDVLDANISEAQEESVDFTQPLLHCVRKESVVLLSDENSERKFSSSDYVQILLPRSRIALGIRSKNVPDLRSSLAPRSSTASVSPENDQLSPANAGQPSESSRLKFFVVSGSNISQDLEDMESVRWMLGGVLLVDLGLLLAAISLGRMTKSSVTDEMNLGFGIFKIILSTMVLIGGIISLFKNNSTFLKTVYIGALSSLLIGLLNINGLIPLFQFFTESMIAYFAHCLSQLVQPFAFSPTSIS